MAHENGFKALVAHAGRRRRSRSRSDRRAGRDHARHPAARHRRLARARPPQGTTSRPGTSPCRSSPPRRTPAARLQPSARCGVLQKPIERSETLDQRFADDSKLRRAESRRPPRRLTDDAEPRGSLAGARRSTTTSKSLGPRPAREALASARRGDRSTARPAIRAPRPRVGVRLLGEIARQSALAGLPVDRSTPPTATSSARTEAQRLSRDDRDHKDARRLEQLLDRGVPVPAPPRGRLPEEKRRTDRAGSTPRTACSPARRC